MKLQTFRPAMYVTGALSLGALVLANVGYGTYHDGIYDPPPINIAWLAALIVAGGSNAVAFMAYMFGWKRK